jgi:hypothetical protein
MNGFKEDVISILRDNVLLHAEAMGLLLDGDSNEETRGLLKDLQDRKLPVTDAVEKHVFNFDYVVLHRDSLFVNTLIRALSLVSKMGMIILDVTGKSDMFRKEYFSKFGDFSIHKLIYEDRAYLVIKNGMDYGN